MRFIDLTGRRFGRLVVESRAENDKHGYKPKRTSSCWALVRKQETARAIPAKETTMADIIDQIFTVKGRTYKVVGYDIPDDDGNRRVVAAEVTTGEEYWFPEHVVLASMIEMAQSIAEGFYNLIQNDDSHQFWSDLDKRFQSFYLDDDKSTSSRDPDFYEVMRAHDIITFVFIDKSWVRVTRAFEDSTWGAK